VSGRCDAGCSVDVRSDVPLADDVRRPGVDPDAHANWSSGKHLLRFRGRGKCSRRSRERDEERVALGIHFDTVVARERLTQGATMLRQRVCIGIGAQTLQEPRRALDVGEDKRDGSGRKFPLHRAIQARRTTRCRPLADWFAHCQGRPYPTVRKLRSPRGFAAKSRQLGYLTTFVIGALRTMCASFKVSLFAFASDLIWSSLTSKTGLTPDFHVTYISSQSGL